MIGPLTVRAEAARVRLIDGTGRAIAKITVATQAEREAIARALAEALNAITEKEPAKHGK